MAARTRPFGSILGQKLKHRLPFHRIGVSRLAMFFFAAASIAGSAPDSTARASVGSAVQATATIRILSGARLSFHGPNEHGIPHVRVTMINTIEGRQRAHLIEFE
jgi:hypothetical protein